LALLTKVPKLITRKAATESLDDLTHSLFSPASDGTCQVAAAPATTTIATAAMQKVGQVCVREKKCLEVRRTHGSQQAFQNRSNYLTIVPLAQTAAIGGAFSNV
jgi:hypothetical protein